MRVCSFPRDVQQIEERSERTVKDRVVAGDPLQSLFGRVGSQRLKQFPVALSLDLVDDIKVGSPAVSAEHVATGNDLDVAAAVFALDFFLLDHQRIGKDGIHGYQFLE